MQGDAYLTGKENTNPNWLLRKAIITGKYNSLNDTDKSAIDANPYLRKLYEDRYINTDSEAFGVFFNDKGADQIYPYEYWDETSTLANADVNSQRFIEYCQMLGVIPRFSGMYWKGGKLVNDKCGNFSGAVRNSFELLLH